jgi:hypothetical protein
MIILHLHRNKYDSDEIIEQLKDIAISYQVVYVDEKGTDSSLIFKYADPPQLIDDDRVVQGKHEILRYIDTLKDFIEEWQKFQSDACYCDEEGNVD